MMLVIQYEVTAHSEILTFQLISVKLVVQTVEKLVYTLKSYVE